MDFQLHVLVEQLAFADPFARLAKPVSTFAVLQTTSAAKLAAKDKISRAMYTGAQWNNTPIKIVGDHHYKGRNGVIVDHHEETALEKKATAKRLRGKNVKKAAEAAKELKGPLPHRNERRPIVFMVMLEGDKKQFPVEEVSAVHR